MNNIDKQDKIVKLSHSEIVELLKNSELDGFRHNDASISKIYRFDTFAKAINFMFKVSEFCEEIDHHPNWTNIYNRVEVDLSTHDILGVSEKDLELAKVMNKVAKSIN
ncbi:MAG: 4a-hydroxytetrahydrobiopterin dehydratase [Acidimicrobiia bacterium]